MEHKTGVSKLQLLYDEITQEEQTRQQRKEQKKLKRRKKKERQAVESKCKASFILILVYNWVYLLTGPIYNTNQSITGG